MARSPAWPTMRRRRSRIPPVCGSMPKTEFSRRAARRLDGTQSLERGRLSGLVSGQGEDVTERFHFGESTDSRFGPGIHVRGLRAAAESRWRLRGYRHALVRIDQSFSVAGRLPAGSGGNAVEPRAAAGRAPRGEDHRATGSPAAFELLSNPNVGEDRLTVGATLGIYTMHLDSQFRRFFTSAGSTALRISTASPASARRSATTSRWRRPSAHLERGTPGRSAGVSTWSVTGVRDHGKRRAAHRQPVSRARHAGVRRVDDPVPREAGEGPHAVLTMAGEVTWINYSRLREDFVTDQAQRIAARGGLLHRRRHRGPRRRRDHEAGDPSSIPRFRGGFWFDPDHSVSSRRPCRRRRRRTGCSTSGSRPRSRRAKINST